MVVKIYRMRASLWKWEPIKEVRPVVTIEPFLIFFTRKIVEKPSSTVTRAIEIAKEMSKKDKYSVFRVALTTDSDNNYVFWQDNTTIVSPHRADFLK